MPRRFPFYKQHDAMDCGAACLRMVARHHGRFYSLEYLRNLTHQRKEGVSLLEISDAAEQIGYRTLAAKVTFEQLSKDLPLPVIAYWRQDHYLVVYRVTSKHVYVADPAVGNLQLTHEEFLDGWLNTSEDGNQLGVVLVMETTPEFFQKEGEEDQRSGFSYIFKYLSVHKDLVVQLVLGLVVSIILQLVFPFLMQAMVDEGVEMQDFNFVLLILMAWFVLFLSQVLVEHLRSWILLHVGFRANINLISDFLIKIVRLPIRFFDQKMTTDLLKRIYDNERVERLLTTSTLVTFFSSVSILLMGLVLLYFDLTVFLIFFIGTLIYFIWVLRFMQARRELDYKRFDQSAENQAKLIELINGMQEIKLNNAETQKRWEWERTEAKLFRAGLNYLAVDQRQRLGAQVIDEIKNILILIFSAQAVIQGNMSLGVLFAVLYIVGQMKAPVKQLVDFIRALQDARISLERMNEVHQREDVEDPTEKIGLIPDRANIKLEQVSFQYGGLGAPVILSGLNCLIPHGKTTAIVGSSGSGKTTFLKLLLNIYQPAEGTIKLGDTSLNNYQEKLWRSKCGAVLQEGYIFSDTIARNIALGDEVIDDRKLLQATRIANIQPFIDMLPLGFNTKIGAEGIGLSQGQRQRLLIARAVYGEPEYFFFDEATNALDAYNEMVIMENLADFFEDKTMVLIAHRLSTIMNADQILVLEAGEIVETGTHEELVDKRGMYHHLLRNQIELGA